jgi:membrane associated rhomboid family serine protease
VFPIRDNVPTRSFPVVTVGLIAVNVIVWLWEVTGTSVNYDVAHYAYYPCTIQGPCLPRLVPLHHLSWWEGAFTSMFMHGGWVHIGGNMLFLWIFGNNVEDALGRVRFLVWYLVAGLAATALQTFVTLRFAGLVDASIPNVGASGAIAGVLGGYLVLLPTARVLSVIFFGIVLIREIPAIFFLGAWFVFQLVDGSFSILQPQRGGGVAFFAHIGGFAFGVLTVRLVTKRPPLRPAW